MTSNLKCLYICSHSSSYNIRFINSEKERVRSKYLRANCVMAFVLGLSFSCTRQRDLFSRCKGGEEDEWARKKWKRNQISDSFLPVKDLYQLSIRLCQALNNWKCLEGELDVNQGVIWIHSLLSFFSSLSFLLQKIRDEDNFDFIITIIPNMLAGLRHIWTMSSYYSKDNNMLNLLSKISNIFTQKVMSIVDLEKVFGWVCWLVASQRYFRNLSQITSFYASMINNWMIRTSGWCRINMVSNRLTVWDCICMRLWKLLNSIPNFHRQQAATIKLINFQIFPLCSETFLIVWVGKHQHVHLFCSWRCELA